MNLYIKYKIGSYTNINIYFNLIALIPLNVIKVSFKKKLKTYIATRGVFQHFENKTYLPVFEF